MPRWEHGSEDRLKTAAIELFDEQGFEGTSVVEIAERARLTTRTFFRYFSDKREVLFAGTDGLGTELVGKIADAASVADPLRLVVRVLASFDWAGLGSPNTQRRRRAVIDANPQLLERDLGKQHSVAVELADALRQRGVERASADLAARVGVQVFYTAYSLWIEGGGKADLASISEAAIDRLSTIMPKREPALKAG